jgi:hypothetical protein
VTHTEAECISRINIRLAVLVIIDLSIVPDQLVGQPSVPLSYITYLYFLLPQNNMTRRNKRWLRDETGNQYCKNCEQEVYAETPFRWLLFITIVGLSLFLGATLGQLAQANPMFGFIAFLMAIAGPASYIYYWYFKKRPICPICNAKNFGVPPEDEGDELKSGGLSSSELEELLYHLRNPPTKWEYDQEMWTPELLIHHVHDWYDVDWSAEYARKFLYEANEAYQAADSDTNTTASKNEE